MRSRLVFFFTFLLFSLLFLNVSFGEGVREIVNLTSGKNKVFLNFTNPIGVESLIKLNPDIEAVSYTSNGETIGYVNVFNGIGKNFILEEREYEISVKKNLTLVGY